TLITPDCLTWSRAEAASAAWERPRETPSANAATPSFRHQLRRVMPTPHFVAVTVSGPEADMLAGAVNRKITVMRRRAAINPHSRATRNRPYPQLIRRLWWRSFRPSRDRRNEEQTIRHSGQQDKYRS